MLKNMPNQKEFKKKIENMMLQSNNQKTIPNQNSEIQMLKTIIDKVEKGQVIILSNCTKENEDHPNVREIHLMIKEI